MSAPIYCHVWGVDLSGTLQGAGGVGGLLAVSRCGRYYLPCMDAMGNIVKYIDEDGAEDAGFVHGPFGEPLYSSGADADAFHLRFSTKYYDDETGLYYYGERFYSPTLGRWLNRDPIEEKGGSNIYAFCDNNPFIYIDYLGLDNYWGHSPPWGGGNNNSPSLLLPPSHRPDKVYLGHCGNVDVTDAVWTILHDFQKYFNSMPKADQCLMCKDIGDYTKFITWDIQGLANFGNSTRTYSILASGAVAGSDGMETNGELKSCERTVVYEGKCHHMSSVNYLLWGYAFKLCNGIDKTATLTRATAKVSAWKSLMYGGDLKEEAVEFVRKGFADKQGPLPEMKSCRECEVGPTVISRDFPSLIFNTVNYSRENTLR